MKVCNQIKVLITGSSGFIGSRLLEVYDRLEFDLIPVSLQKTNIGDIDFEGVDAVVHLAGLAEQKNTTSENELMQVNTDLTCKLAEAAKKYDVKHFIFMSSIKVYGDSYSLVDEETLCLPKNDIYGKSKLLAEKRLVELSNANFTVSILRSPVVYGPNVKGNILRLLKLSDSGFPLPLGSIDNRRSMVFVDNLVEFVFKLLRNPSNNILMISDLKPISTTYLISTIRKFLGRKPRLWKIPDIFLSILKKISPAIYSRLFKSLEVQTEYSYTIVGYKPKYSFEEGIKITTDWYKSIDTSQK